MLFVDYRLEPEMAQDQVELPNQPGNWQLPKLTFSGMVKMLLFIFACLPIHAGYVYWVLAAQRAGSSGQVMTQLSVLGLRSTIGKHCMLHMNSRMLLLCSAGFFDGQPHLRFSG